MNVTNKDCVQYIIDWYQSNQGVLPLWEFVQGADLNTDGSCGGLSNGLTAKAWRQVSKVKVDNKVHRVYSPRDSVVDGAVQVTVTEIDGAIQGLAWECVNDD